MTFYQAPFFYRLSSAILSLPGWWYLTCSRWFFGLLTRLLIVLADRWALPINLRLIFKPLYQDYTVVGVIIGPVIRFLRLLIGGFSLVTFAFGATLLYLMWLSLPGIVILSLGYDLGFVSPAVWILLVVGVVFHLYHSLFSPSVNLTQQIQNIFDGCTRDARKVLNNSRSVGEYFSHLAGSREGNLMFTRLGFSSGDIARLVRQGYAQQHVPREDFVKNLLKITLEWESELCGVAEIMAALISMFPALLDDLQQDHIDLGVVKEVDLWLKQEHNYRNPPNIFSPRYVVRTRGGVNKSWSARPTPLLNQYSEDLTLKVQRGYHPPIVAKEEAIENIINILSRKNGANVLIVGEAGSGKSSILLGLAEKIIDGNPPPALYDKRLVVLDPSAVLEGTNSRGEVEKRIRDLVKETQKAGNVILAIEEIHTFVSSGEQSELSPVFTALESQLEDTRITVIGTSTFLQYRKYIEPNRAFSRHFHLVELAEANEEQTLELLKYKAFLFEDSYPVVVSFQALLEAVRLAHRFIHERVFPDKAIDLLESAVTNAAPESGKELILARHIAEVVSARAHVPLGIISKSESATLLSLEKVLH
jgi:hypothetical protein